MSQKNVRLQEGNLAHKRTFFWDTSYYEQNSPRGWLLLSWLVFTKINPILFLLNIDRLPICQEANWEPQSMWPTLMKFLLITDREARDGDVSVPKYLDQRLKWGFKEWKVAWNIMVFWMMIDMDCISYFVSGSISLLPLIPFPSLAWRSGPILRLSEANFSAERGCQSPRVHPRLSSSS